MIYQDVEAPMRPPELPRMFENDWLDALSRAQWWTVPLIWVPGSAGLFLYGMLTVPLSLPSALLTAAAGWLAWTLTEYIMHRYAFHWIPNDTWGARLHFIAHGAHHRWHQAPCWLVMPPVVNLTLGLLFGLLFSTLFTALGAAAWCWPFYSGFTLGYMIYDLTHYAVHRCTWRHPSFQALKRHHLLHHHSPRHAERNFGVSTTLWDRVFGTR